MTPNQLEQLVPVTQQFDLSLTINDIVARYPETIGIFNRFGMDTCCGGAVTVEEAARRDGIDAAEVIAALRRQIEGA
jgi:regulator of cell morphogenesis and NO signaling